MHKKTTLDNGLRIVTSEMPHTRSVTICAFIGVGSRYEDDHEAGLSHFLEHMVFKGTERRPEPQQITAAIEGDGGIINALTEHEFTMYWCKVSQPHFETSIELLVDMLRNSLLKPDDIEKERMVIFEELAVSNDYPGYRVETLIDELVWHGHPLGRDIGGTRESVADITRDMMLRWLSDYYAPSNIVISVAGAVSHDAVVAHAAALCDGWDAGTGDGWLPFEGTQSAPKVSLEYRKTEQTHMCIALPAVSLTHPHRYPLDLLSVALGEGMSSRLFVEVREKRGLAYDVHSEAIHFSDTGSLVISAGVDPKRIYDATQTILEQLGELGDGVPEDEIERAKRLSCGRLLLSMEDTRAVATRLGQSELMLGEVPDLDDLTAAIDAVTYDDTRSVANDLLLPDNLSMAVVGPCRGQRRLERMLRF